MNYSLRMETFNYNSIIFFLKPVVLSFSLILLLKVKFYLPFTPVPFVLYNSIAILYALIQNKKSGVLTVVYFLFQIGIFSGMDFSYLLSPIGGYMLGFLFAAYFCNVLKINVFSKILLAHLIVLLFGMFWLSFLLKSLKQAFLVGLVPFVFYDFMKSMVIYSFLRNKKADQISS
ncbi:MAG: biotin transporter BioY [Parachlamydiales bacterium]|nr:biotin transporter BioY [Parachlamydiales bacterium]